MKVLKPEQYPLPVTGSFTRASTATYIDEGILQTAAIDVPRWQDGQLLIELSSTNYVLYSQDISNAAWTGCSVSSTTEVYKSFSPFWTVAKTLATSSESRGQNTKNVIAGEVGTFTVALLSGSVSQCSLGILHNNPTGWGLDSESTVDILEGPAILSARGGSLCTITGLSATVPTLIKISRTFTANGTATVRVYPGVHTSVTIGDSVKFTRVQYEVGSENTSYIPTTTTTVTRSADVITGTGLIWTNATESTAAYSSGTTYSLGQQVVYQNVIYESLQNANLNHTPSTSPTWWLSLGADNITAFIDNKVSTQSTRTANLRAILATGKIAAAGLLEIDANLINFQVNDRTTYDVTYSAQAGLSGAEVFNWYDYFFVDPLSEPIKQVVFDGIPSEYSSNIVSFSLDTGDTDLAALGYFVAGLTTAIGKTQYGVRAGIIDYSKKDTDEFGNTIFVERPYSKRLSADVYLDNYDLNKVQRFLYSIRATPVLWMASDDPQLTEAAYVYGFYKDFSTTISYPTVSMCNLEIEGLT